MPRKRTGTIQPYTDRTGLSYWRARIRLSDGSRPWLRVPEAHGYSEERAREWAASMQEREDREGKLAAAKVQLQAIAPPPAETVAKWSERWLKAREQRGLATFRHDQGRLKHHVLPLVEGIAMRDVSRTDVERIVEDLDRKIALPPTDSKRLAWKTAGNVWVLVTKMFDDAVNAKSRDLRVRSDNPASGVRGPERGVARSKTYLYPSEFTTLVSCPEVALEFRQLYAVAVLTAARAGELEALTWADVDREHSVVHINKAVDRRTGLVTSTKSGETRRIPIHPRLRPLLEALYKAKTGERVLWMPDDEDRAIMLRQHLETAHVKRSDLFADDAQRKHITFHDLRATGITWMAVAGEDPLRIKQRAGHQSFSTTEGYIREAENLRTGFGEPFPPLPASLLESNERSNVPRRGPKSASIPASYFVEQRGIEPLTSALRTQRSPS